MRNGKSKKFKDRALQRLLGENVSSTKTSVAV